MFASAYLDLFVDISIMRLFERKQVITSHVHKLFLTYFHNLSSVASKNSL